MESETLTNLWGITAWLSVLFKDVAEDGDDVNSNEVFEIDEDLHDGSRSSKHVAGFDQAARLRFRLVHGTRWPKKSGKRENT